MGSSDLPPRQLADAALVKALSRPGRCAAWYGADEQGDIRSVEDSRSGRVLDIYVAPACTGSETARRLAVALRALALPDVEVRLIDLSEPGVVRPPAVFAVPTYLLDGRVLSLGNPDEAWLLDQLAPAAARDERRSSGVTD